MDSNEHGVRSLHVAQGQSDVIKTGRLLVKDLDFEIATVGGQPSNAGHVFDTHEVATT